MSILHARPGDVITFVCGPGESSDPRYARAKGIAYGFIKCRFGTRLRVKMDDYTFRLVDSFSTVGIGIYHFPK